MNTVPRASHKKVRPVLVFSTTGCLNRADLGLAGLAPVDRGRETVDPAWGSAGTFS
ncbi:MAG: hypothetical protein AB1641_01120 [Thermodesulfobacteriota bacterium]